MAGTHLLFKYWGYMTWAEPRGVRHRASPIHPRPREAACAGRVFS